MFVAYTAKIRGIIECWQYYGVCEDYNGVVSKVLGDGWLNPRILSVQSLEAHQHLLQVGIDEGWYDPKVPLEASVT